MSVGTAYGAFGSDSSVVTASTIVEVRGTEPVNITTRTARVRREKPKERAK